MQDGRRLSREYARALAARGTPPSNVSQAELLQEIDNILFTRGFPPEDIEDVRLRATVLLTSLRSREGTKSDAASIVTGLEAHRADFADHAPLYAYLVSAPHFYVARDADETLRGLPEAIPGVPLDYTAFSQQTLRGLALEAKGKWTAAEKHWLDLVPLAKQPLQREQLELNLAINYERSGRLEKVFATGSPIETPGVRQVLLLHVAGPAVLRRQAEAKDVPPRERDVAVFTLLYKDLLHGHPADFLRDLPLLPDEPSAASPQLPVVGADWTPQSASLSLFAWPGGTTDSYTCPSIRDVARLLQKNPRAPRGLNCLGEFILRNGLDGFLLSPRPADELGGSASQFPGTPYSRLDGYMQVLADAKAPRNDRAYALYRAIHCFARTGSNRCGSQNVEVDRRKGWFRTLKTRYPDTPWAEAAKYYW
jgi:hypothetical protein